MAVRLARANRSAEADTLSIGMLDPFQMACIRIESRTNAYLHHCEYLIPGLLACSLTCQDMSALSWKFTMPKRIWLRYAMEDPGLLHSVLFVASAHYGFATTKSRTLTTDAKRHAAAAITCIKECLQDPARQVSDQTIGALARLITWSVGYYPPDPD